MPSFRRFWTWPVFWQAVLAVVLVVRFKPWDEGRQRLILANNWDDYVEMNARSWLRPGDWLFGGSLHFIARLAVPNAGV